MDQNKNLDIIGINQKFPLYKNLSEAVEDNIKNYENKPI